MKNIKGRHCANCHNCRCKDGMAWCSKGKWLGGPDWMLRVDIRSLSAKYYKDKAVECSEYQNMEG